MVVEGIELKVGMEIFIYPIEQKKALEASLAKINEELKNV